MSKERIIPNEVVLVGEVRKGQEALIDNNLPLADKLKAVMAKYKFTRDTTPSEAAKAAGFNSGKFFQMQMSSFSGESVQLPGGKTVKRSNRTTKPGFDNIFESNRSITFNEIKEELLSKDADGVPNKIELVGGDANSGKIRLKEYALMGFWDEFPAGFKFTPHSFDKDGKLKPLQSHPRENNYKPVDAVSQTCRHFVYEDEVENLEGRRDIIRSRVEKWKIKEPVDNTDSQSGAPAPTPAPKVEVSTPADDV